MAVLELKKDGSVIEAIVNAIVSGYKDDLIIEELASAVENETVTKEQFEAAVDALKLYAARFANSVQNVVDSMSQFEFNDKRTILKSRPMNLAQQVLQDVEGFNSAAKEYYDEDDVDKADVPDSKEADIKKPQLDKKPPEQQSADKKPVDKKPDEKQTVGKKPEVKKPV